MKICSLKLGVVCELREFSFCSLNFWKNHQIWMIFRNVQNENSQNAHVASPVDTKTMRKSTELIESFIFCRRSPLNSQNLQQESSGKIGKFQEKSPNIMKIKIFRENHGFSRFSSQAAQTWYPASRSSSVCRVSPLRLRKRSETTPDDL